MDTEPLTCDECGAPRVNGMRCDEQLAAIAAWEWQDPELLALHFLTVGSYNLQHPAKFTPEAIAALTDSYLKYIDRRTTIADIRKRMGIAFGGDTRVLRPSNERLPVLRHWDRTIADVYLPDRHEGAANRVQAWASAIRENLRAWKTWCGSG